MSEIFKVLALARFLEDTEVWVEEDEIFPRLNGPAMARNIRAALREARAAALEEAAKACEGKAQGFLSPEYATGQPLSSFSERFACGECATAIRALADKPAPTADTEQVVTCYECGGPLKGPYCPECVPLDVQPLEWQPIETAPKDGTIQVQLTKGLATIADASDKDLILGRSWQAHERRDGKGYYAVSGGVRMHRLIMGAPDNLVVDHIDGNGLNNCRSNLRIGTQSQNCVNRKETPGAFLRGTRPKKDKWQAYIKFNGKQRSLGYYATEAEAHAAYLSEALRLHGDWMPLPAPPSKEGV